MNKFKTFHLYFISLLSSLSSSSLTKRSNLRLTRTNLINSLSYYRSSTLTNPEDLVNVGSPLREASPRPEVRVVAPAHRPPSVLATVNNTNNTNNGSANRKSVSILLPEHSSGWPQQQHGFVHRCDKDPPTI